MWEPESPATEDLTGSVGFGWDDPGQVLNLARLPIPPHPRACNAGACSVLRTEIKEAIQDLAKLRLLTSLLPVLRPYLFTHTERICAFPDMQPRIARVDFGPL